MSRAISEERRASLREVSEPLESVFDALLDRGVQLEEALAAFEVRYLRSALARHGGNLSQASAALGIHRNTLRAKLQRNGRHPRRSG